MMFILWLTSVLKYIQVSVHFTTANKSIYFELSIATIQIVVCHIRFNLIGRSVIVVPFYNSMDYFQLSAKVSLFSNTDCPFQTSKCLDDVHQQMVNPHENSQMETSGSDAQITIFIVQIHSMAQSTRIVTLSDNRWINEIL